MKPSTATPRSVAERAPIGYVVVACFLSFACYNLVPGSGTAADVARTAAGALCAVALLAVGDPAALRPRSGQSVARLCVWLVAVACAVWCGFPSCVRRLRCGGADRAGCCCRRGRRPLPFAGCGRAGQRSGRCGCPPAGAIRHPCALQRGCSRKRCSAASCSAASRARPKRPAARTPCFGQPPCPQACSACCTCREVRPPCRPMPWCWRRRSSSPVQAASVRLRDGRRVRTFAHNLWLACGLHAAFKTALSEGPLFLASGYLPPNLSDRKRGRRGAACRRFRAAGAGRRRGQSLACRFVAEGRTAEPLRTLHGAAPQAMGGKVGFLSNEHIERRANRL